jgi:hypothetical protein
MRATVQVGASGTASDLYSEGSRFETRPAYRLISLRFSVAVLYSSTQVKLLHLTETMTASFHILYNSLFTCHRAVQCCVF